jgi:hypothetical protein
MACDEKTQRCYDDFKDKIKSLEVENLVGSGVLI